MKATAVQTKTDTFRHTVVERYQMIGGALGDFVLVECRNGQLRSFWLDDDLKHLLDGASKDHRWLSDVVRRLRAYFAGQPVPFDDVPTPAGSPFFQRCWQVCRSIEPGTTISYGELAQRAGSPKAVRAAGQAMRHNPLPIIVPCHRVVASTGSLHGFSGSTDPDSAALQRKKRLLELER